MTVSFFPSFPGDELDWVTLDVTPPPLISRWDCPPGDVRPEPVALSVELGRSASTVVLIDGARVYPDGVVLRLTVRVREQPAELRRRVFQQLSVSHGRGMLHLALPPGGLRWGVEFADGQRVTSLDDYSPHTDRPPEVMPADWVPDRPVMRGLGRVDTFGAAWARDIWLWPLPPPGPLRLVCAWPDRGVPETATSIDAGPLRDAAARARPEWPVDPEDR